MRHLLLLLLLACSVQAQVIWGTFQPATSGAAGAPGVVPGPAAGDQAKFLRADATWQTITPTSLVIGTDVQAYDADLDDLADGTLSKSKVQDSSNWDTAYGWGDHAAAQAALTTRVGADETRLAVEVFARLAADAASVFALPPNAWVDQYEDQTGVDDPASTGEYYDATNDLYSNVTPATVDLCSGGTASSGAGTAANAFDNSTATNCGDVRNSYIQYQLAEAIAVGGYSVDGFSNPAQSPTVWTFAGSNDGTNWTTLDTKTGQAVSTRTAYVISNPTAYLYYRWSFGDVVSFVEELELFGLATTAAATIIGEAKTTTAAPTAGKIIVLAALNGGAVNTALSATLSRDGGTTDCAVTLASAGAYDGTYAVYEGECTFTGAEGTSLRYELTTDANQTVNVKAVSWMGR